MTSSQHATESPVPSMRVVPLDSSLEQLFWDHVNQDVPDYFFFIFDMKKDRASTEIWLALRKQNRIAGMMMIYRNSRVQMRGSVDAAKALLGELSLEKMHIQAPTGHEASILSKYPNVRKASEIILMTLRNGEQNLLAKHATVTLSTEDAGEVAVLMRRGNPDWWAETTEERVAKRIEERLWLGIRVDGKLVSVGGATVEDLGSNIATVVTHEGYRNRGYATSVVSALVEQILRKSRLLLIHAESDNKPAIRVYTKVGFKPYKRYFLANAEK